MSDKFDAYHEWLGIQPREQPPNHYRLLGISLYEQAPGVIENAADQRMAHLRNFQTGKHVAESQRLLNEVAAAKLALLNPAKKAAYDKSLRARLPVRDATAKVSETGSVDQLLAVLERSGSPGASGIQRGPAKDGRTSKKVRARWAPIVAMGIATVSTVAFAFWVLSRNAPAPIAGENKTAKAPIETHPPANSAASSKTTSVKPPSVKSNKPTANNATAGKARVSAVGEPDGREHSDEDSSRAVREKPEQTPEDDSGTQRERAEKSPAGKEPRASAAAEKIALPSKEEQAQVLRKIDEVYAPGSASTPAEKAKLARQMLDAGRQNESNRTERFVLLRRAAELARDAVEGELMLEAVDAIAAAGFDIKPNPLKSQLLIQLFKQNAVAEPIQCSSISSACVKFAEDAAADGAGDEATEVLAAAQRSLASAVPHAAKLLANAKVAAKRARTPADKSEKMNNLDKCQGEVDALKAAQAAVAESLKNVKKIAAGEAVIRAAQEKLKAAPDDPDACLTVGSWYCFKKSDSGEGLKLLAKSSDSNLKKLAGMELSGTADTAADKLARGDAWWETADGQQYGDEAKAAMRNFARNYYRDALPDLPEGREKTRVEKRLAQPIDDATETARHPVRRPPLAVAPFDEPTAKDHQERWARYLGVSVVETNSIDMKLVLVPPGEFIMGSTQEAAQVELQGFDPNYTSHVPSEVPQHRVRISQPFRLGMTHVTQAEYQRVMGVNPSHFQGEPNRPVECVSWANAMDFCRRLSSSPKEKSARRRYVLPTEAQWEYACRAGTTTNFYFSGSDMDEAWLAGNSGTLSHPVMQKKPNGWGLYDMHGDVFQWCQDWWVPDYYSKSPVADPLGPSSGMQRAARGGSWKFGSQYARSGFRGFCPPAAQVDNVGFRVALLPSR
jgi:formylglycine-generating enzyme required for sulfatase activity